MPTLNRVLLLGSGAIKIGQAGEFDYSGSQAIKALKEEGLKTILVNPNIATVQTSEFMADTVYFLPVSPYFVEKIIAKEKPDAVLISFGGQTALNCGIALHKQGVFQKYNVQILGTSIESVIVSEDRALFAKHLRDIGLPTPTSRTARSVAEAVIVAQDIGYPVMIRGGFALGGQKSGVAHNQTELAQRVKDALVFVPHVLVEQYLHPYKEIEYEIVRDRHDNCVAVCNMENMDPLGIHTGESIVVAPSQTLTNFEYHFLRQKSIELVRSLNIIGECNVQFALNPKPRLQPRNDQFPISNFQSNSKHAEKITNYELSITNNNKAIKQYNNDLDYHIIELNPRLSRSSALASKATGYPLAYVAAKLILGKALNEVSNQVTQVTQSCFEPALDYIVVKIPRWDLEKFRNADFQIGSSMKSVGEVMGIGRTFEEALQKAVRMLDIGAQGATDELVGKDEYTNHIKRATPKRLFALAMALRRGESIESLQQQTGIDPWFLYRVQNLVTAERTLKKSQHLSRAQLLSLKQLGFADARISALIGKSADAVRTIRKRWRITPAVFQIDTLAGEVPAKTNYLYLTYNGSHHDVKPTGKHSVIVLGCGPYRIGSSVEFDWMTVNTARYLRDYKRQSIVINCNPETVSTDYDISDRLYFEELTLERVLDIYEFERPEGVIVSVGGQRPNTLAKPLAAHGCRLLGTKPEDIDKAEDRSKFSAILDTLQIPQPAWDTFTTVKQAEAFAQRVGYPVLIRPSYVLSGSAMHVCYTPAELQQYLERGVIVNRKHSVTVSKYFVKSREIEMDGVAQKGTVIVHAISEHIEHAGVHSGDATIVYPPNKLYVLTEKRVRTIGLQLVKMFNITGPFNIQFLAAQDNRVSVIELNARASRTLPFISKVTDINFAKCFVDTLFHRGKLTPIDIADRDYVLVKVPQFSFSRLDGADPLLHVEMASTGEAAGFGKTIEEAFLKAELSVGTRIPEKGLFISLAGVENKVRFLESIFRLSYLKVPIFATENTAKFLQNNGINAQTIYSGFQHKEPSILSIFAEGKVDCVISIADPHLLKYAQDAYRSRRAAVDHNIPIFTNLQKAALFITAITSLTLNDLEVKSWQEYRG